MAFSSNTGAAQYSSDCETAVVNDRFPTSKRWETTEQRRRFELLRLAFFALKLRKLDEDISSPESESEREFCRNLLRHAIFQQVLALIELDAREQALQIIAACR
jgi:hypothetical protein